jgi:hypothetical protein
MGVESKRAETQELILKAISDFTKVGGDSALKWVIEKLNDEQARSCGEQALPTKIISVIAVNNVLTALGNDGTVWLWGTRWTQLPALPHAPSDWRHENATGVNVDSIHDDVDQVALSEHDTRLGDDVGIAQTSGEDEPAE